MFQVIPLRRLAVTASAASVACAAVAASVVASPGTASAYAGAADVLGAVTAVTPSRRRPSGRRTGFPTII